MAAFAFPQAMSEFVAPCPHQHLALLALWIFVVLSMCDVVSICLSLLKYDDIRALICHLCVFFGEVSVQIFHSFLNYAFCFLVVQSLSCV